MSGKTPAPAGGRQIERAAWNASFEAALDDGKEAVGVSPGETSRGSGDRIVLAVLVLLLVLILLSLLILLIRPLRNVVSTFFRFRPAGPRETEKKGRKAGGPGAAAAILDALDRDMEKEILTEIEGLSAQLAAEIRQGTGK